MKRYRLLLGAFVIGIASAAYAARARAGVFADCGPWQHCLCRSIGCSTGGLLCMSGQGLTCYQGGITEQ